MSNSVQPRPAKTEDTLLENKFWLSTWRDEQEYGFHQLAASSLLKQYWQCVNAPPKARVLVPLCGKSLDMLWLAEQGFQVIGVELSPIAVKAFFQENGLKASKKRVGSFVRWQCGNITIFCGDFFALPAKLLGRIDAVFDRAALTAMPDTLRPRYLRQMLVLISPQAIILLLTVEDIVEGEITLPVNAIDKELERLCRDCRVITLLQTDTITANSPAGPFTTAVYNKAYLLSANVLG